MPRKGSLTNLEQAVRDKIAAFDGGPGENTVSYRRDQLGELATAAQLIDGGQYGKCVDCDGDIPFARLQAKPEAIRCVPCQSRHEQGSGRYTSRLRSAS